MARPAERLTISAVRAPEGAGAARRRGSGPAAALRSLGRWLAVVLAVAVPAVCWGVGTARAEGNLGPHLARYDVTLDHLVTIDLGPLGTLVLDSPLPLTLGARVVVQEIPDEVSALSSVEALGGDLAEYVQFFSAPDATIDVAVRRLAMDAAQRSLIAALLLVLAIRGLHAALGPARRTELRARLGAHATSITAGVVVAVAVSATLTASDPTSLRVAPGPAPSTVFAGTPLEGARVTGRLSGVLDTFGGRVVDAYRANEAFYDGTALAVRAAWQERAEVDDALAARVQARRLVSVEGAGDTEGAPDTQADAQTDAQTDAQGDAQTDAQGDAHGGQADIGPDGEGPVQPGTPDVGVAETADDAGSDSFLTAEVAEDGPEPVVLLVVSDLHCNVGMARVIRAAAELSDADVVLNAGDTTVNGTAVEAYCVTAFVDAVPPGATMVVADGNHDSRETSAQERAVGAVVLEGSVVEVAGLRVLGDRDPHASRIGVGTTVVGEETIAEAGRRLAEVACTDADGVDLLLVHNPNVGNAALTRGCVPAQISGHMHTRWGPAPYGSGVRYISSSTAGAVLNAPTVGPLRGLAEMTVLRFDPASRAFLDYRLVSITPDGAAQVGPALPWPTIDRPVESGSGPR